MLQTHILIALLWIFYGVFHSLLASGSVKRALFGRWPGLQKFYRLGYGLFALVTLCALIWWQIQLPSIRILGPIFRIPGVIVMTAGLVIMFLCIRKYFAQLSGLRSVIHESPPPDKLRTDGLHRHVRHPLYAGTFLFLWGLFLALPTASLLLAVVIIQGYTMIALRYEEAKLHAIFGADYAAYSKAVPRLWPHLTTGRPK